MMCAALQFVVPSGVPSTPSSSSTSIRRAVEELQSECINNLASLMHLRWAINRAGPALEGTSVAAACGASGKWSK